MNPENRTHRILVAISVILLTSLTVGGSVYYVLSKENKFKEKEITALKNEIEEAAKEKSKKAVSKEDNSDWKNYKNADGFEFTMKETWKDFKVFKVNTDWGTNGNADTYYFTLPTISKEWKETGIDPGYASLFAVTSFTKEQWDKIKSEDGPVPAELGSNDKFVFTYNQSQADPDDVSDMRADTKAIIGTFKLSK